jgi:hypothetical protein
MRGGVGVTDADIIKFFGGIRKKRKGSLESAI